MLNSPGELEMRDIDAIDLQDLSTWDTSRISDLAWVFEPTISSWKDLIERKLDESQVESAEYKHYKKHVSVIESLGMNAENGAKMLQDTWMAEREIRNAITTEKIEDSTFSVDTSQWDVSNVKDMDDMFQNSFNADISQWRSSSEEIIKKTEIVFWKMLVEGFVKQRGYPDEWIEHYQKNISALNALGLTSEEKASHLQASWHADKELRKNVTNETPDVSGPSIE